MIAAELAKALGGHRAGAGWMARCPAHEDRKPSLSISSGRDGKVLVRCHSGCDQRDVIAILRQRCGGAATLNTPRQYYWSRPLPSRRWRDA